MAIQTQAYKLRCVVNSPQNKTKTDSEDQAELYHSPTIEITNAAADTIQTTAVAILVFSQQSDIILFIFSRSKQAWTIACAVIKLHFQPKVYSSLI